VHSLYLHIPFCAARCPFCDFAISTESPSEDFAKALKTEIRTWGKRLERTRLDTIHLGGGTPSLPTAAWTGSILETVRDCFEVSPTAEIALECNPGDADTGKMAAWKALGITRLSIGAQSFDDRELCWLGRGHSVVQTLETVRLARTAGFANLSLDLIYGVPGQTLAGWGRTLDQALALKAKHLSVYALTLEGGRHLSGPPLPPEGEQAEMAFLAMERLEGTGLRQYEISNFARDGFESRHNLAYWTFAPYLGLGPSAHSYLAPRRFSNVAQTPEYVSRILAGKETTGMEETLTPQQVALERLFLGLRLPQGIQESLVTPGPAMEELLAEGLVERHPGRLALTRRGRVLCDAVTRRLLGNLGTSTLALSR